MALEILNKKKVEANGLLSKIEIGGKVYEIKDLIARENVEGLSALLDALSAKVGNVAEGQNLADIIKNIQENGLNQCTATITNAMIRHRLSKLRIWVLSCNTISSISLSL